MKPLPPVSARSSCPQPRPGRNGVSGAFLLAGLPALATVVFAQSTWDGGGADLRWSTEANWSTEASPAGTAVLFGNTLKTTASAANSVVDESVTVDSLTYTNTGASNAANWHVTQIDPGVTLTLNGASSPANVLVAGGQTFASGTAADASTYARITGEGALAINAASSSILVGNISNIGGTFSTTHLDLGGLAAFSATVNQVNIGHGQRSIGIVTLAENNTIVANGINIGNSNGANSGAATPSVLNLGQTNSIKVNSLRIGAGVDSSNGANAGTAWGTGTTNQTSGTLQFASGLEAGASVVLRGKDSTEGNETRVLRMVVGSHGNNVAAQGLSAIADFRGGQVDALIGELLVAVGRGNYSSTQGLTGAFYMDAGTVDVTSATIGLTVNGSGGPNVGWTTGTLDVGGGSFTAGSLTLARNYSTGSAAAQKVEGILNVSNGGTVDVAGGITLGSRESTATELRASIHLSSGGALKAGGNIAEGTGGDYISSSVTLDGGSLDLAGHALQVDTFTVKAGGLKNLAQFNVGTGGPAGDLVKTTDGALLIEGVNAYTGATDLEAGVTRLAGSLTGTSGVVVRAGATFAGAGEGGSVAAGVTVFDGRIAAGNAGEEWGTLAVDSLDVSAGATLAFTLGAPAASPLIDIGGALTAGSLAEGGLKFEFTAGSGFQTGVAYTLLGFASSDLSLAQLALAGSGLILDPGYGINGWQIDADSLSVRFAAVPEPAATALWSGLSLMVAAWLLRSRKR